jgi:hypothetical protein
MEVPAQFRSILNDRLSVQAWLDPRLSRLPGVQPLDAKDWLLTDEVFAAQMAYRDWLLTHHREDVFAQSPQAEDAAKELFELVVTECGFALEGDVILRPDGVSVDLTEAAPLVTAARLTQSDLCILQDREQRGERGKDEPHILTAGVMCFPSSWKLSEKMGRSLASIHTPVDEYDDRVATSVQRMFKAIRVEQPLWRANFLIYTDPELHQPRGEGISKPIDPTAPRYVRVERQTFRRLPITQAVVFGIQTSVVAAAKLSTEEHNALSKFKPHLFADVTNM